MACTGSSATTNPTTGGGTPTSSPSTAVVIVPPSSAPSLAPSVAPSGSPTPIDPCELIPSGEASQLAGATFGTGEESTTEGGGRICTYGANTTNVFEVIVGQASSVAEAKAGKAEAEAGILEMAAKGVKFTELAACPGGTSCPSGTFADGAAYFTGSVTFSGVKVNGGAMYALSGLTFFGFSDLVLSQPAPTADALEAEAQVVLGRLP
jgi:hypothetical protein